MCLLALPLVGADNELKLGNGSASTGGNASVSVTLSTVSQVQGLVAAFDWNGAQAEGVSLVAGAALAGADTVVVRVEPSYMVLGVVMDSDGIDGEVIQPGTDLGVATATIKCLGTDVVVPVEFRDGQYATVDGGPQLDNIVVVGGLSIGEAEGLVLTDGEIACGVLVDRFYIDSATATSDTGTARVLMDNRAPVEGYVVSLCHPAAELTLGGIAVGAAASASDFSDDGHLPRWRDDRRGHGPCGAVHQRDDSGGAGARDRGVQLHLRVAPACEPAGRGAGVDVLRPDAGGPAEGERHGGRGALGEPGARERDVHVLAADGP